MKTDVLGFEETLAAAFSNSCDAAQAAWDALCLPKELRNPDSLSLEHLNSYGGLSHATQRRACWLHWAGVTEASAAERYAACLSRTTASPPQGSALADSLHQIALDVERTFPEHAAFAEGGAGLLSLRRVLQALAAASEPNVESSSFSCEYVQGQNYVVAFALLALRRAPPHLAASAAGVAEAEPAAFAVCSALLHCRLAPYFYAHRLSALREDLDVVSAAFCSTHPDAFRVFDGHSLSLAALCPRWMLCAFVGAAPSEAVLRLWDALLASPPAAARAACRSAAGVLVAAAADRIAAAGNDASAAAAALRDAGGALASCVALCRAALEAADEDGDYAAAAARVARTPPRRKRLRPAESPAPLAAAARLLSPGFGCAVQSISEGWARLAHPPSYAVATGEPRSSVKRGRRPATSPPASPEWHARADGGACSGGVELQDLGAASARKAAASGGMPLREVN
jgi:hypothetical protein